MMAAFVSASRGRRWTLFYLLINCLCVLAQSNRLEFTNAEHEGNTFEYNIDINQNVLEGQVLFTVNCIDTQNSTAMIQYSIIQLSDTVEYFTIDETSGEVKLSVDSLTLVNNEMYSAQIQCHSPSSDTYEQATLTAHYQIENEFRPTFVPKTQIRLTIEENNNISGENAIIYDFNATDSDRGSCGQITYSIGSNNRDLFQIESTTGILSFIRQLDYEERDQHTIVIDAKNPNPPCTTLNTGSSSIVIEVTDINDTPPKFEHPVYNITIPEADYTSMPLRVITVLCFDPDTTSHITYFIPDSGTASSFDIDNQGNIRVAGVIDYEASSLIIFQVSCRDTGRGVLQIGSALINVTVLPRNEHRPKIQPNHLLFTIGDIIPVGTLLISPVTGSHPEASYTVTDADQGSNHGDYNFTISSIYPSDNYTNHFTLDHKTGDLILAKKFDKDECGQEDLDTIHRDLIDISITVCDLIDSSTCEILTVSIYVIISDCDAYFPPSLQTNVSLSELTMVGSEILAAPCLDYSDTTNKTVTIHSSNSEIDIDQVFLYENGHVILTQQLDYETSKTYNFELVCINTYNTMASVEIFITVLPENDNPPVFDQPVYIIETSFTDNDIPRIIGEIQATDKDNDSLTYSLVHSSQLFLVDSSNGQIMLYQELPTTENVFNITIEATDGEFSVYATIVIVSSDCSETQAQEDKGVEIILIVVFSILMIALLLLSWVLICCLLRRKGKTKEYDASYRGHYQGGPRNFTDYDIPIGNSAIECMAFNGTSFVNDPSFNGRAKEPLPMEPEYETLAYKPPQDEYKSSKTPQPYAEARKLCHLKAAPQNSTDCYVSMQTPSESTRQPSPGIITRGRELEIRADNSASDVDSGNDYVISRSPQVKINNVRRDFESSLEFGGSLETSLEFGGARETSLDFVGASQVCRRATRSTSPREICSSEAITEGENRLSVGCRNLEAQENKNINT